MGDAFLSWRETYAVGHLGLDREHQHLVELINEIAGIRTGTGGSGQLSSLSNAFYLASVDHFRHENSVMRDLLVGAYLLPDGGTQRALISEAAINDHCAEHAQALIKMERALQAFSVKEQHGSMLASELRVWFLDHAINHDAHLKDMFQASRRFDWSPAKPGQAPDHSGY